MGSEVHHSSMSIHGLLHKSIQLISLQLSFAFLIRFTVVLETCSCLMLRYNGIMLMCSGICNATTDAMRYKVGSCQRCPW